MPRTLTRKMILGGVGLLLSVAIAAAFAITSVQFIQTAVDHLTNDTIVQVDLSGQFNTDIFRAIMEAEAFARTHDPADRADALHELADAHAILAQLDTVAAPDGVANHSGDIDALELQRDRVAALAAVDPRVRQVIAAVERNDPATLTRALADLTNAESAVETIEERSSTLAHASVRSSVEPIQTAIKRTIAVSLSLFGLFGLAVFGLLVFMRYTIARPITHLSAVARLVAEGHFDHAIAITNRDEIGSLQANFNHMIGQLRQAGSQAAEHQRTLEARVAERTYRLAEVDQQLQQELAERQQAEAALVEERALLARRVAERTAAKHPSVTADRDTASPAHQAPQAQILVVDDNQANLAMVADYLSSKGYRVFTAHEGAMAVAQAQQMHPDLIVMDIQMPGVDGLEATRRIRADPSLASVPIIALTALAMPGDRDRCLAAGATAYLSKPVRLQELFDKIEAHRTPAQPLPL